MMRKNSKILIVGHNDIMEKSLCKALKSEGFVNVFSSSAIALNTSIQPAVYEFFSKHRPEYVFLGSIKSGGIAANQKYPADFIYLNSESQNNIIYAASKFGVKKLLYIASSCVYPKDCPQPMKESYILTGAMELTSLPYSLAKSAGIVLCQSYKRQHGLNAIVMIPATVYGPGSDTHIETSHVLGALIKKFSDAVRNGDSKVTIWGTGRPQREFLYCEDFVAASFFLMKHYTGDNVINVGCGEDISILELANIIAKVSEYRGEIVFDSAKPDGTYRKLLDNTCMSALGWKKKVNIQEGIKKTYRWFELQNQ